MRTILVGVDGSPEADNALRWAFAEAAPWNASVTAMNAWQPIPYGTYAPGIPLPPPYVEDTEHQAEALVAEAVKRARHGLPFADALNVTTRTAVGPAPEALERASRQADLVVVGSRPASALHRAIVGSTTSAVLHHSHCPVVVVPDSATPTTGTGRVLVGVDHGPAAVPALAWAAAEAARRQVQLQPIFVRPELSGMTGLVNLSELEASERSALRHLIGRVGLAPEAVLEPEILVGSPGEALVRDRKPDDLLVLGSRGRGALRGWLLGSSSNYAIHHAPCAVVVVREPAAHATERLDAH